MVLFDQDELNLELEIVLDELHAEMNKIRTGRPSLAALEGITAMYYGVPTKLKAMAQISIDSAMSATIKVNDKSDDTLVEVRKALDAANTGAQINEPEKGLFKLNFQPLTGEDRNEKVKELGKLLESKRDRVRGIRRVFREKLEALDKVPEDDVKRSQEDIQEAHDSYMEKLEAAAKVKERELKGLD